MAILSSTNYTTILRIVYNWPPDLRFALIRDLLDTLEPKATADSKAAKPSVTETLRPEQPETDEAEWLYAAAHNPAFKFLHDPAEDIYSVTDGQPSRLQGQVAEKLRVLFGI